MEKDGVLLAGVRALRGEPGVQHLSPNGTCLSKY